MRAGFREGLSVPGRKSAGALYLAAILALPVALLVSCSHGNGIPNDIMRLLDGKGIRLKMLGYEAPVRTRGGYVYFAQDAASERSIVEAFSLKEVEMGTPGFSFASRLVPHPIMRAYILGNRPKELRLPGGSQLEYLFLLVSTDGRMYLVSEYAYG